MTTVSDQRRPRRRVSKRAKVLLTVAGVLGMTAAVVGPVYAVSNGEPVKEGKYRFAVKLTMPKITSPSNPSAPARSTGCSAALISREWIVSAGHCFHDGDRNRISGPPAYQIIATVGTADATSGKGITTEVVEIRQAPNGADLAIARLATPVRGVRPLRVSSQPPAVGATLRLVGFGYTVNGSAPVPGATRTPSDQAFTGTVKVRDVTDIQVGVGDDRPLPQGACIYDSGAPYFTERHGIASLVAVESDGPACPHNQREIAARADNLRDWMRQVIGGEI